MPMDDQRVYRFFYLNAGCNGVGIGHERRNAMHQLEMAHLGCTQLHKHLIGDAQELQGVMVYTPLDIFVGYAIDIHLAIHSFKGGRVLIVGQMCNGYFDGDELGFIVLESVQFPFQLPAGPVLHKADENAVTHGIEEKDPS